METTTYEAKTAAQSTSTTKDAARGQTNITPNDKAHYAADDDINWDTWWGEYIDEAK